MDRYELVEGKSSKFWEVEVEGATLTVRYGRLGTDGQTKEKDFADAAAATKEKHKLVREKTGKGYALVDGAGETAPPKPTATKERAVEEAGSTSDPEPSSEAVAEDDVVLPPAQEVDAAASAMPSKAVFDAAPLPTRMRPGRHIGAAEAWRDLRERLSALTGASGASAPAPADETPSAEDVGRWLTSIAEAFVKPTNDAYQHMTFRHEGARACLEAAMRWLVESEGALAAARLADRLRPAPQPRKTYEDIAWSEPLLVALRAAIVHAPDKDYDDAAAFLEERIAAVPDWRSAAAFAFILADDRGTARHALRPLAVLEAAAAAGVDVGADTIFVPLVVDSDPVEAARWRSKRSYFFYLAYCVIDMAEAAATLVDVARAHGRPALPGLDWLMHYAHREERTVVGRAMLATGEPGALGALVPILHEKPIVAALDAATAAAPAATFAQCVGVLAGGRSEPALRSRVADALERHGAETCRDWLRDAPPRCASFLDQLMAARDVPLAAVAAWPRALREPPWRQKARAKDDIVLALTPIATPDVYDVLPGEPDHWRHRGARVIAGMGDLPGLIAEAEHQSDTASSSWTRLPERRRPVPEGGDETAVLAWLEERLRQVDAEKRYYHQSPYYELLTGMEQQPEPLALMLWSLSGIIAGRTHISLLASVVSAMLARFGDKALPGLVGLVEADPIATLAAAREIDTAGIAPPAARALFKLKKAREPARAWLRRHRATAVTRLLPDAVGKPGAVRDAAEHALRFFVADRDDGRPTIEAIAAAYAENEPRVSEAVAQVRDRDPLVRVPAKVGKPPAWVAPSALARPCLRDGGALPDAAVLALCEMLSFTNPDDVYAGIGLVRDACTPDSLAAFAWDLFSAWVAAGTPSKDGWALRAVGWLGDDSCARELTRLIRRWPGESAHQRAVTGLDVLADIGSDVALMNLNGIAEKLKFKGLQDKARAKIAQLAEARGLTPEELSDRLAPDLDLDERGGLDLDFGPRTFRAGFDELLKPWVKDASGQRLKDLPKPIRSDDTEKAAGAVARWAALKKDARAAGSLQLNRLEAMLATSRRLRPQVFWMFFAAHPLVRHLTQRLVWATFADADPRTRPDLVFRVAEDLSITDAADAPLELDVSAETQGLIGLLHPLHVDAGALAAWGALFGDYEITQPFPQLGRETFAFTPDEAGGGETSRFDGIRVESARVRGMAARGWPLGTLEDHGVATWIEHHLAFPDGTAARVSLMFEGGIFAGARDAEDPVQTLRAMSFDNHWTSSQARGAHTFGELDAITASELLRGPSLLAETRVR